LDFVIHSIVDPAYVKALSVHAEVLFRKACAYDFWRKLHSGLCCNVFLYFWRSYCHRWQGICALDL